VKGGGVWRLPITAAGTARGGAPGPTRVFLGGARKPGRGRDKPLAARIRDQVDQWSFLMWRTGLCDSYAKQPAAAPTGK